MHPPGDFSLPVESFRLPNGLSVVVQSDHASPLVAVALTYKVGSRNERPGRSGFAHLFEHLMAQGTRSIKPREISKLIESNGGVRNAFTTRTNTTYHSLVPKGALELVLWAEAERMHTLDVDARALALEQNVVLEEMRLRYLNAPYRKAMDAGLAQALFSKWENRHTTIGEKQDVERAELGDVRAFYRAHYGPNNAVLSLAGDVELERARALTERWFGPIAPIAVEPQPDLSEPAPSGETRVEVQDPFAKTPRLVAAWRAPERSDKDFWALSLLGQLLSGDDTNPLYQAVVKGAKAALGAEANFPWWSSHSTMSGPDAFGLVLHPRPGKTPDEVLAAVDAYLARLRADGPSAADLELAKAQTRLQWVHDVEQLLERATLLGSYAAFVGEPAALGRDLETLLSLTPEDVRDAARRRLGAGRAVVSIVPAPAGAPAAAEAQRPVPEAAPRPAGDRPPAVEPPAPVAPPALHEFSLSNGLNVTLVCDARLPIVEARLLADAGRACERAGEEGLTRAAAELLFSGAGGRGAEELAAALARLGWSSAAERDEDFLRLSAAGLAENAPRFFEELGRVLAAPDYPDAELSLWKEQYLQKLRDLRHNPEFLADQALRAALMPGHPYGRPAVTDEQVEAITPGKVRAFQRARVTPAGARLVLTGALDAEQARPMLERALSGWTGAAAARPPAALCAPASGSFALVDRPGSTQANLVVGQTVPLAPGDEDYVAFQVMNQLLGGSATSRLFVNLRVERGYTYGAYSCAEAHRAGLVWSAEAQVRNEVAQPALDELRKEIARMRQEPVPEQQLAAVKRYLAGIFLLRLASLDRVADFLRDLSAQGRDPRRALADYIGRLDRLAPEDVQAAARRYLEPEKMTTVVVGDARVLFSLR